MNALRIASLTAALLLTASLDLLAQQDPPVSLGDRVRITAPTFGLDRQVGTVAEMDANSLSLQYGRLDNRLSVSIASLTKLEVSRGTKSHALMGLSIGALGGAGVGFLFGLLVEGEREEGEKNKVTDVAIPGVVVGAVVGFAVGVFSKSDRWEEVPLNEIRVGLSPVTPDGVAVSVALRLR